MRYNQPSLDGTMDTTLGLIMRLNFLWTDAQNYAIKGDYISWNFILDAIWRNLLYRDELESIKEIDKKGNEIIIEIKLSEDDRKLWYKLNANVIEAQRRIENVKSKREYKEAMGFYYAALQMKDVGLRKFQHKLKLYVKEKNRDTSNVMWGG